MSEWQPTGESYRDAWSKAHLDGKRSLLQARVLVISVRKGKRGRHGLDPERVSMTWMKGDEEPR